MGASRSAGGGHLPIRIRAVPEGTVVPTHEALMTIESTDPQAFWVPSYLETMLLRIWYPITVATISWHAKQTIRQFLERTSDDPAGQLPFKLHDFGARGTSSVDPRLTSILGGIRFTSRSVDSGIPNCLATSAGRMVLGTCQAVQVASGPLCLVRLWTNK